MFAKCTIEMIGNEMGLYSTVWTSAENQQKLNLAPVEEILMLLH